MGTRRISFYWAQGEAAAPDIVRRCWDLWARMNPGWEVDIHDAADAQAACDALGIAMPITRQAQSDIFRVWDLAGRGGVYADAGVVPMRPLDDWLPDLVTEGFFAFHDPYRRRQAETWFLYAVPGNPLIAGWQAAIARYWQAKRRPQRHPRELDKGRKGALACWLAGWRGQTGRKAAKIIEPRNRLWSVRPDGGGGRPVHPYFWPHYLFDLALAENPDLRAVWERVPKEPSYKSLMLRHSQRNYAGMSTTGLERLVAGSDMQKLLLDVLPRRELLDHLLAMAAAGRG